MKNFQDLITKWENHEFSSGGSTGQDFKDFARDFKATLKLQCKNYGYELIMGKPGHYDLSGFIRSGDKFIYFSISDVRGSGDQWFNNILIRSAKHSKDYSGGHNNFTNLDNLFTIIGNYIAY